MSDIKAALILAQDHFQLCTDAEDFECDQLQNAIDACDLNRRKLEMWDELVAMLDKFCRSRSVGDFDAAEEESQHLLARAKELQRG